MSEQSTPPVQSAEDLLGLSIDVREKAVRSAGAIALPFQNPEDKKQAMELVCDFPKEAGIEAVIVCSDRAPFLRLVLQVEAVPAGI